MDLDQLPPAPHRQQNPTETIERFLWTPAPRRGLDSTDHVEECLANLSTVIEVLAERVAALRAHVQW